MQTLRTWIFALARLFLSAPFLISALYILLHWHETEKKFLDTLFDWQEVISLTHFVQEVLFFLGSWSPFVLLIATAGLLLGGFFLLFGIKERLGAFLLFFVAFPATILYHPFWFFEGGQRELQMILFFQSFSIMGGLLFVILLGGRTSQIR